MTNWKEKVYDILDNDPDAGPLERSITFGLITLIVANVIAVILESEPALGTQYAPFFYAFEVFSVTIFTMRLSQN